jgi:alkanesulfonate monooxygenase SsuD/methylene tetrahydromethanopterin reductase-like flavin-dependent oxidoreductase (luciferase family)
MVLVNLFRGKSIAVPRVDEALEFVRREGMPAGRRIIAGSPSTVRRSIEEVARAYRADEVLIVTVVHDHAARRRSYELIAREFELEASR